VGFEPRPLTDDEDRVLDLILAATFEGVEPLRAQSSDVRVVGRCACGCPSIELAVAADRRRSTRADGLVPVELNVAPLADELPGQVILFVRDGELSCLEFVFYEDRPPTEWPTSDRLSVGRIDR
jgi:hypothetical protein